VEVITLNVFVTFKVVVLFPPVAVKTVASVMVSVDTYCVGTLPQLTLTGMFSTDTDRHEQALLIRETG
jgi:hypothetical protein